MVILFLYCVFTCKVRVKYPNKNAVPIHFFLNFIHFSTNPDHIKTITSININDIAVSAVLAYLDALESKTENLPQEPEKTAEKANTERTEVEEKVALMQANERLHQLQEQRRAERKASEQPQVVDAEEFLKNINK